MNAMPPGRHHYSALFPDADARAACEESLDAALRLARARVQAGPVGPDLDAEGFRRALDAFDFRSASPLGETLDWVIEQLQGGIVHVTHPRYFGLFNPAPSFPAECAERIVACFNPQLASARTSPVPVAIEAHVIRAVAERAGLPAGSAGHFTSGGSEANFAALTCALTRADPRFAEAGVRAFSAEPVIYVSDDAHLAWHKIMHQSGLGRSHLRSVATDRSGRLACATLREMLAADRRSGLRAVMIVGTAGTTCAGMIDPLAECGEIAREAGAWFHVDAAWGGALIASPTLRHELAGMEEADSLTIDAHKWFATTMACGMFITRHAGIVADAFHAAASFMPSDERQHDPYMTTAQWSRRFLGLRLFLALATAGWSGYGEHVERAVALAATLAQLLQKRGWRIVNDSSMAVLCVQPPAHCPPVADIVRKIVASNSAWISTARFGGGDVIRICITNGQTSQEDILALARLLEHSYAQGADKQ